jgi:hypothetical protein
MITSSPNGRVSCVDGRPAHRADPLANDQDRALVLWLRSDQDRASATNRATLA